MDAITGHETGGPTGRKVDTHLDMEDLQRAIQMLSYDSISLPRVYALDGLSQGSSDRGLAALHRPHKETIQIAINVVYKHPYRSHLEVLLEVMIGH